MLRNTYETSKAGFDKILRNIQAEGRMFVCYKKTCMRGNLTKCHNRVCRLAAKLP